MGDRLGMLLIACLASVVTSCAKQQSSLTQDSRFTCTLYRNSLTDPSMRIHIATFDSVDDKGAVSENGLTYNGANCDIARGLFQSQGGVTVKFWCEQGKAR
jgi:hypothetical protein